MREAVKNIPNWNRFSDKFPEFARELKTVSLRISELPEGEEKDRLAKLVNVELGIAMLRENEIDRESFSKLLQAIAK